MQRIAVVTCLIAGFSLGATSAMAEQIKTKQQFLEQIAGRKLVQQDSWVTLSPDGTVNGKGPAGGPITGKWVWEDSYYCREITIDDTAFPRDCQTVTRDGDTVNFIHDKGSGITVSWKVE